MSAVQRRSSIVLVVFGRVVPVLGELHRIDLVGMGEDLCWLGYFIDIIFCNLVYMLEFLDTYLKFWCVGRSRGQVFK